MRAKQPPLELIGDEAERFIQQSVDDFDVALPDGLRELVQAIHVHLCRARREGNAKQRQHAEPALGHLASLRGAIREGDTTNAALLGLLVGMAAREVTDLRFAGWLDSHRRRRANSSRRSRQYYDVAEKRERLPRMALAIWKKQPELNITAVRHAIVATCKKEGRPVSFRTVVAYTKGLKHPLLEK
jgi:hypothetical protein